eukprot:931600-Amphidinium_carterae.1
MRCDFKIPCPLVCLLSCHKSTTLSLDSRAKEAPKEVAVQGWRGRIFKSLGFADYTTYGDPPPDELLVSAGSTAAISPKSCAAMLTAGDVV